MGWNMQTAIDLVNSTIELAASFHKPEQFNAKAFLEFDLALESAFNTQDLEMVRADCKKYRTVFCG